MGAVVKLVEGDPAAGVVGAAPFATGLVVPSDWRTERSVMMSPI